MNQTEWNAIERKLRDVEICPSRSRAMVAVTLTGYEAKAVLDYVAELEREVKALAGGNYVLR